MSDLEEGLEFYRNKLGMELLWRRGQASAGLKMSDSDTELVLVTEKLDGTEVDVLVDSVDDAANEFVRLGGEIDTGPFDIKIGRCSVLKDRWGNRLVILDMTKGPLTTDQDRIVQE